MDLGILNEITNFSIKEILLAKPKENCWNAVIAIHPICIHHLICFFLLSIFENIFNLLIVFHSFFFCLDWAQLFTFNCLAIRRVMIRLKIGVKQYKESNHYLKFELIEKLLTFRPRHESQRNYFIDPQFLFIFDSFSYCFF